MKENIPYALICFLLIVSCNSIVEIKPERKDMIDAVFASGKTVSSNQYKITAFTEGYLNTSFVVEGDSVKKGQHLFRLENNVQQTQVENALVNFKFAQSNLSNNSPQILQLQQQINQAIIKKQIDSINFNRYQRLIKTDAVAKVDYDKVSLDYQNDISNIIVLQKSLADLKHNLSLNEANTKAQYKIQQENNQFYTLTSETNGLILTLFKKNGDLVKKGESIADIGTGKIIAKLEVAEDDIQRIQLNQQVVISLNTNKNKLYKAFVSKIYPSFDESTQSFFVEATFTEMPDALKQGTQLQANFIITEKKNVLVIPSIYLLDGDSVQTKNEHKKIAIKTGIKTLEYVEIISGLSENDILESSKQK
jgi:multidrug efflux pump subunit AcrA (membrane-fusion protein)